MKTSITATADYTFGRISGAALLLAVTALSATAAQTELPQELRIELEKQKAALRAVSMTYTETQSTPITTQPRWITNTVYFQDSRWHLRNNEREIAFDGTFFWHGQEAALLRGDALHITKYEPSATNDTRRTSMFWTFSYLEAASLYAPAYIHELERFTQLEPALAQFWEESDATTIQTIGGYLRITMRIDDRYLLNFRMKDPEVFRTQVQARPNSPEFKAAELETFDRLRSMVPKRTITFLLDPRNGYRVVEREEALAKGGRICRVESGNWKYYSEAGIWLPGRCVVQYYATPYTFKEFSDQPLQSMTLDLNTVEFKRKPVQFALSEKPDYQKAGTLITDRTIDEAKSSPEHGITYTVAAGGKHLRGIAENVAPWRNSRSLVILIILLLIIPPVIFLLGKLRTPKTAK